MTYLSGHLSAGFMQPGPADVTSLPSKGGVGWLVVYVNQRNSLLVPVSTKGIIGNKQCSYLIQWFYLQLLRYKARNEERMLYSQAKIQ